jgi:stalled ribosome rescue protein Dom34
MSTEKMRIVKKLAIWMDHASAHIIEYPPNTVPDRIISSDFTSDGKKESLEKSERIMHNKERQDHLRYYKELAKVIMLYDEVLLFGPTEAKSELLNFLRADHRFDKIKIKTETTGKMTTAEEHGFVKEYFTQPINL